eukprot:gnl/MRDRNA2_/MRDRNA2_114999_c0_seq1.p1 gnl/MRDRNA2_/MRDRNA2_114999_c0~~gnl/MRDRNA2_/MRDRNA2_114999_c0_seq1.p1  ORF type:complete len:169 (+),score=24.83 gnl/MRDRNA2_/MRDRNA2_114999_c0_seq1:39-545(+)
MPRSFARSIGAPRLDLPDKVNDHMNALRVRQGLKSGTEKKSGLLGKFAQNIVIEEPARSATACSERPVSQSSSGRQSGMVKVANPFAPNCWQTAYRGANARNLFMARDPLWSTYVPQLNGSIYEAVRLLDLQTAPIDGSMSPDQNCFNATRERGLRGMQMRMSASGHL